MFSILKRHEEHQLDQEVFVITTPDSQFDIYRKEMSNVYIVRYKVDGSLFLSLNDEQSAINWYGLYISGLSVEQIVAICKNHSLNTLVLAHNREIQAANDAYRLALRKADDDLRQRVMKHIFGNQ